MGLFAFFYGLLHLGVYFVFDRIAGITDVAHSSPFGTLWQATRSAAIEILERPFFASGFLALAALAPLAATSTVGMIRSLGGRRWHMLHRLVYPAAIASVVHMYWPLSLEAPRYVVILLTILLLRLAKWISMRPAHRPLRMREGLDSQSRSGYSS